jgi:hypothetical protein
VEATDVITAVTGTCPSVTITVRGVPVAVNGSTVFGSGITCAGLAVDVTVKVTALLTVGTGGAFSVVATRVETASSAPAGPGAPTGEEDVAGTVASVAGTCPARTITLAGTTGVVVASATTTFDPAGACSTVAAGTVIRAHGTRNTDGQLVATTIKVYEQGSGHGKKVSGEGRVAHVTGTCPALSMIIVGVRVTTSGSTTFEGGCSDLRPGSKVAVTGDTQTDGSVAAVVVRTIGQPGNGHGNGHK